MNVPPSPRDEVKKMVDQAMKKQSPLTTYAAALAAVGVVSALILLFVALAGIAAYLAKEFFEWGWQLL